MRDLEPQRLRLREVEARIAFAERTIQEQEAVVLRLTARGHSAALAHELLANLRDSLAILVDRRRCILALMQEADAPLPPHIERC
ncbi:MAG: hypothetical protein ACTHL8_16210 [Burkholderiaceae bacterium]